VATWKARRVYVYLSKILPVFVMPITIVMVLVVVALAMLARGRTRIASGALVAAVAVLWIASMPLVAEGLYRHLETRYPPLPLAEIPESGCIVLLGGVVSPPLAPRVDLELSEPVDRVYKSAQLYRAGKAQFIIVTAGNQPWSVSPWAEADLIRDLLQEWGVPHDAIFLEGSSRNTRENAVYTKNVIDSIHCETALLVTSAAHMPRAVAAFQAVGVSIVPVSTDVRVVDKGLPAAMDFLPSAAALAMTSEALREWIGQAVYRLQGWG
jgi:uncharacterized SAM-binding protein YcdF (DUF218 family)